MIKERKKKKAGKGKTKERGYHFGDIFFYFFIKLESVLRKKKKG